MLSRDREGEGERAGNRLLESFEICLGKVTPDAESNSRSRPPFCTNDRSHETYARSAILLISVGVISDNRVEVTGIFRAVPKRLNPKQRVCRSVYKTYVDVIHFRCRRARVVQVWIA